MSEARVKILLIEDDRIDQMAFERFVKREKLPYDYKIADTIAKARKLLATESFDMVISDYSLPDGDVLEILRERINLPLIITTGTGTEEIAVEALKSGAADYLIKDPDRCYLKVLPATLERVLKQRETERQIAMLSHAIRSSRDSVFIADRDSRIIFVNQAFCDIYGYEEKEILGSPIAILWKDSAVFEAACPNKGCEGEFAHQKKGGLEFPVLLSTSVLRDESGKEMAVVGISRDMTERKRTEKALLQKTEELAHSRAELEQLELFAFVTSHNLQEPLRKIVALSDLLEVQMAPSLNEEGRDYLKRMEQAVRQMSRLIERVRDLSRVASEAKDFERVDLGNLVREVVLKMDDKTKPSGARVEVDKLPEIFADKFQMEQVFLNLIDNALKFSKKDSPPQIRVYSKAAGPDFVEIHVEDRGIGFDEKYLDRIFKPFQRLNKPGEYEGSGLGLSISRKVILRHGGKLSVRSTPGKGSDFILLLPRFIKEV